MKRKLLMVRVPGCVFRFENGDSHLIVCPPSTTSEAPVVNRSRRSYRPSMPHFLPARLRQRFRRYLHALEGRNTSMPIASVGHRTLRASKER